MRANRHGGLGMAALFLAVSGIVVSAGAQGRQAAPAPPVDQPATHRRTLTTYCQGCHSAQQKARGLVPVAFDELDVATPAAHAAQWEAIVRKMRAGLMPPSGVPRPDKATTDAFLGWIEGSLDRAAAARPNPGRKPPFHRLNRTEYQNAVRDLLAVELDVSGLLPADDSSYGFDNIAGVLKLSPTLVERYLGAAQKISRIAVGTPPPFPAVDYFRVADDRSQEDRLPEHAPGTRGGTRLRHTFPMDATYAFRVELTRDLNEQVPIYDESHRLELSIDGVRVQVFTLPGIGDTQASEPVDPNAPRARTAQPPRAPRLTRQGQEQRNKIDRDWEARIPVTAGTHDVQVSFLDESSALAESARLPFQRPYPAGVNIAEQRSGAYLRSVEISGPFDPTGPGDTPSRRRILTCRPQSAAQETACATTIFRALARRAFRRPVTNADIQPLLAQFREGRTQATPDGGFDGGFDRGIERGLTRLLVAPEFLVRVETDPANATRTRPYPISDVDLASRLSFFLWSSIPDEELLRLAERGRLHEPAVLDAQVRRMMADARFGAFVEGFAGQWLFLRNLNAVVPVQQNFPDFDDTLRQAFRRETELFFESIVRENRSALDLLRADYTFVNERLARHYGIPNVKGPRFRRLSLAADSPRAGLLGHGSILTVTSYPDRTSPVVRGKWVLENLLGAPPPAPPPNVPPLEPSTFADAPRSVRERMVQHRRNPVCASCHSMMDPIGLSLENFDAVGKYRTREESGATIDSTGALPDGTAFAGSAGLRAALLQSDLFVRTLTEKLLTYALGRGVEYYDQPTVRAIVRESATDDYRLTTLIGAIVRSAPFRMRAAVS